MKIKRTDWHFRLLKFMYGKYTSVPTSLCPYFWKVVLTALFILPASCIGYLILNVFNLTVEGELISLNSAGDSFSDSFSNYIGGFVILILGTALSAAVGNFTLTLVMNDYNINIFDVFGYGATIGLGFIILVVLGLMGFGIYKLFQTYEHTIKMWIRKRKLESGRYKENELGYLYEVYNPQQKRDGLFKSMWNATIDRVCPMIEIID